MVFLYFRAARKKIYQIKRGKVHRTFEWDRLVFLATSRFQHHSKKPACGRKLLGSYRIS